MRKRYINLVILLIWVFTPVLLFAQNQNSVEGDHKALMDIYYAMNGDKWHNDNGWGGSASTMGNWFGVTTNSQGRVTHLDLQTGTPFSNDLPDNQVHRNGNNLNNANSNGDLIPGREFPESIGNLKELRYLNVKSNTIRGPIPQSITLLTKAERILLEGHWREPDPGSGSGNVPYNHPVSSSSGKTSAGTNFWTGSIPSGVGNLKNLVVWESAQTGLSGNIPAGFGQLQKLEMLLLSGIRGNSDSSINLSGSIPSELGNASSLRYLMINDQNLSGSIPASLGQLIDMKYLRLDRNNLTGSLPAELGNIPDLRLAGFRENNFTGEFPAFFWQYSGHNPYLNTLNLVDNNFSGELPTSLPYLGSHFNVLGLARNNFSGTLPNWVTERRLIQMNLQENNFTGDLPPGFHDSNSNLYRRLRNMKLEHNNFTGPLPAANLGSDVLQVRLHNNNFTGTLPTVWAGINTSRDLEINASNNNLSGYIDPAIGSINNLQILRIQNNSFSDNDLKDLVNTIPKSVNFSYGNQNPSAPPTSPPPDDDSDSGDDAGGPEDEGSGDGEQDTPSLIAPSPISPVNRAEDVPLSITLEWTSVDADEYILHIHRADEDGKHNQLFHSDDEGVTITGTTFTLSKESLPDRDHAWRVWGVKDGVKGEPSIVARFTTTAEAPEEPGDNNDDGNPGDDEEGDDGQGNGGDENEDGDKPGPKEDDDSGNSGSDDGKADDENNDGDTGKEDEEGEEDSGEDEEGGDKPGEKEEEAEEEEIVEEKPRGKSNPNERAVMRQNYPNPFNPSTQIQFSVNQPQQVSLRVYNMAGRLVATLFEGAVAPGSHQATFSADNLASGIYFYRLITEHEVITRQMTFLK